MKKLVALGTVLFLGISSNLSQAQPTVPAEVMQAAGVKELGNGRYQLGSIQIDQAAKQFVASGKIIRHEGPFEFLAIARNGQKAYESLVELDTSAHNFNIACILIGLVNTGVKRPQMHFDPNPVQGDPVDITVSWMEDRKRVEYTPAELFLLKDKPVKSDRWRYTDSIFSPDGKYMAEEFGTLIGFVHDPDSIIHHREGLGLNDYGAVKLNMERVPAIGQPIEITVKRRRD